MRTVNDIFNRKGVVSFSLDPSTKVIEALRMMAQQNIGSVIVMQGGEYKGVLTERDYARKVILAGKASSETSVGEIMTTELPKISPATKLDECMELMSRNNIRYLPVFENDSFKGIISMQDVVKETIAMQKDAIDHLQSYIHSS